MSSGKPAKLQSYDLNWSSAITHKWLYKLYRRKSKINLQCALCNFQKSWQAPGRYRLGETGTVEADGQVIGTNHKEAAADSIANRRRQLRNQQDAFDRFDVTGPPPQPCVEDGNGGLRSRARKDSKHHLRA